MSHIENITSINKPNLKTQEGILAFFNNFLNNSNNDNKASPRLRNEFIKLAFKKKSDIMEINLSQESPNPFVWYAKLTYDNEIYPEMVNLLAPDQESGSLVIEINLTKDYPFQPPQLNLMSFKFHCNQTKINHGEILEDGTIIHSSLMLPDDGEHLMKDYNFELEDCWAPARYLEDILLNLYIEIAVAYQTKGAEMFF